MSAPVIISKYRKVIHRLGCPASKKIKPGYAVETSVEELNFEKYRLCRICGTVNYDFKKYKHKIERWNSGGNQIFYDNAYDALFIRTHCGFWKMYLKRKSYQYVLCHINHYSESSNAELMRSKFHYQKSVECNDFINVIKYCIRHDENRTIMKRGLSALPRKNKAQRIHYDKAVRTERHRQKRTMKKLFDQIAKELQQTAEEERNENVWI